MTNVMKRISAALLSLALVVTMMPFLATPVNANDPGGTEVFSVTVNGVEVGKIMDFYLEQNTVGPQIFPNFTKKGAKYVIAEGTALDTILNNALGVGSAADLPNAMIEFKASAGEDAKNPISGTDLSDAVSITKTVDASGADVDFSSADVFVAKMDGTTDIVPILAFTQGKSSYATYQAAYEALNDDSWKNGATTDVQPYVGGNLKKDLQLKDNGEAKDASVNFTGKFVLTGKSILNIKIDVPSEAEKGSLELKAGGAAEDVSVKYTDAEIRLMYGDDAYYAWGNEKPNVASVNFEFGKGTIKPLAAGTTKVTCEVYNGDNAEPTAVLGEWTVTVKAADKPVAKKAKPAKPASLKVVNKKKLTAVLNWKKSARAEGYVVYRSTKKNKGFKKVATVKKNTYKNKKLKKGKTYYYKVKAYNTANGKRQYSAFSAVKKVKIKK